MVLILITTRVIAENSIDVIQSFAISLNQSAGTHPHSLNSSLGIFPNGQGDQAAQAPTKISTR